MHIYYNDVTIRSN